MSDQNMKEFHVVKAKGRVWIAVSVVLLLIIIPTVSYKYYTFAINRQAQGHKESKFEIFDGESVSSIAKRLYASNLVNSDFLFKVYLVLNGVHTNVQAGMYDVPAGTSVVDLARIVQHGTNEVKITFIEGWRCEEFAREAAEKFKRVEYGEFLKLAKSHEGYLFPDTYFFDNLDGEDEVIGRLMTTFSERTSDILTEASLEEVGLTKEEAIIFASIVEREVGSDEDRAIVAGILIERYKVGMGLEADATVQYAIAAVHACEGDSSPECPTDEQAMVIAWWPDKLLDEDLKYDSPYNTRVVDGLPPAPISNPGLSSITAVINYKETDYNYYLSDSKGKTYYAETLEEHNRNIAEYL